MCKVLVIILCLGVLASCKGSSDGAPGLIGSWKTTSCDMQLSNVWIKGVYEFASDGNIKYERKAYEDSDCITTIDPSRYIYMDSVLLLYIKILEMNC